MKELLDTGIYSDVQFLVGKDDQKEAMKNELKKLARNVKFGRIIKISMFLFQIWMVFKLISAHKGVLAVCSNMFRGESRFDAQKATDAKPGKGKNTH